MKKYSNMEDFWVFNWKIPCNQKFNDGLKIIDESTGIQKTMFSHLGRQTLAATTALRIGVSLESMAKMPGHTSLKHTQIYARVVAIKGKSRMMAARGMF